MTREPPRKKMVLSKRELAEPTDDERAYIRRLVGQVGSARVGTDLGAILQVAIDAPDESQLRTALDAMPGWDVSEDVIGTMPVERHHNNEEDSMPVPTRHRFGIDPVGGVAKVNKTPGDPADYDDREGYKADFLGESVPLPRLSAALVADAAPRLDGKGVQLDYWNFSLVVSKSRRMPFFSACIIDGAKSEKMDRPDTWQYDPRIDTKYQLIDECYGNAKDGFFSRGHMTKREDPGWGDHAGDAEVDTFHAPNQVPQMQSHNAGIWKSLEDYLLKNATKATQKLVVVTGPVLSKKDPVIYGVKIPVLLWKVIGFIHDDTSELASVAYLSSQADFLPDAGNGSFVFGNFKHLQVPVLRIAQETGLDFGALATADVLGAADGSFAVALGDASDLILA
jgi:endonuclease G